MNRFVLGVGCGYLAAAFVTLIAPGWLGLTAGSATVFVIGAVDMMSRRRRRERVS